MTKKSVTILWTLALLLAIGVVVLSSKKADTGKANTDRARGETLLASFPAKDVAKLTLKTSDQSVNLEKKDGTWIVAEREGYPAKTSNINTLLRTIEEVKVNNAIEAGPTYAKRFGVDPDSKDAEQHGVLVDMSDAAGKTIARLALGKDSEGGGRFVRNFADEKGIYVTSEAFPSATANAKDWLDDDFIKVEKITSIQISPAGKADEVEWKLTRTDENAEFTIDGLKEGEAINTGNTAALKSLLNFARFQDVPPKAKLADHQKATDLRKLTISTQDGFTYTITLSAKPNETPPDAIAKKDDPSASVEDAFYMTVQVAAEIKKERIKEKDEKPEDAKTKDEAFAANIKTLEEKLKTEKAYEGKLYEVSKFVIDAVLKTRADFINAAPPPNPQAGGPTPPTPGELLNLPANNGGRIEAVTPPISIDGPIEEE